MLKKRENADLNKEICTDLCINQLMKKIINLLCVAVVFREIRKYQKISDLLMSKTSFMRLMKKVVQDFKIDLRFKKNAIKTLQKTSKCMFVNFFERK